MQPEITASDVFDMVRHWLATPVNGYLGSGRGSNLAELLQKPSMSGLADSIIQKMREDIPIIGALPPGSVNIYIADGRGKKDVKELLIEISGQIITVGIPS